MLDQAMLDQAMQDQAMQDQAMLDQVVHLQVIIVYPLYSICITRVQIFTLHVFFCIAICQQKQGQTRKTVNRDFKQVLKTLPLHRRA